MPENFDDFSKRRDWGWLYGALPTVGIAIGCATLAIDGWWKIAIVLGIVDLVIVSVWTYIAWQLVTDHASSGFLWSGPLAFRAKELESQLLPNLRRKRAPFRRFMGWEHAAGYLEVRVDGLHWRSARRIPFGLFCVFRGSFDVPWAETEGLIVTEAPGRIAGVGGVVSFRRRGGTSALSGEFLGSQEAVQVAIEKGRSSFA
jgi:hypothetical protein